MISILLKIKDGAAGHIHEALPVKSPSFIQRF